MIVNFLNIAHVGKDTRECIKLIMEKALIKTNQTALCEINVAFITAEEIKNINNKERNKDSATDVLSFPAFNLKPNQIINLDEDEYSINTNPENNAFSLGDVLICLEVAKQQAKEFNHSLKTELVRLSLHSILHCLGYDHIKDEDYEVMHKLEMEIMKENGYKVEE